MRYSLLILATFLITTFLYNTYQKDDILSFTGVLTMRRIMADLEKAIRVGNLTEEEVR